MTKIYVFSNRIKMKKSDYSHQNQRSADNQVTSFWLKSQFSSLVFKMYAFLNHTKKKKSEHFG